MKRIKLRQWAENNGYSYGGALKLFHNGGIPGATKNEITKTITVELPENSPTLTPHNIPPTAALYSRVSTRKQAESLARQHQRLQDYASANGYTITTAEQEIASGLNENRPKLHKLLDDKTWNVLIVEYRDRLARFGTRWIEQLIEEQGRSIIYIDTSTYGDEESLVDDLISVVASFTGRLYGKRGAKNKAIKAVKTLAKQ